MFLKTGSVFINNGNENKLASTDNGTNVSILDFENDGDIDFVISEHNVFMDNHEKNISLLLHKDQSSFPDNYEQVGVLKIVIFKQGDVNLDGNINVTDFF